MHVLPSEKGGSLQVTRVVIPRDSVNGDPYREGFRGNIHHGRDALVSQIYYAGKELTGLGLKADRYGKQQVHEMHCSV